MKTTSPMLFCILMGAIIATLMITMHKSNNVYSIVEDTAIAPYSGSSSEDTDSSAESTTKQDASKDSTELFTWVNGLYDVDCQWVAINADIACSQLVAQRKCYETCSAYSTSSSNHSSSTIPRSSLNEKIRPTVLMTENTDKPSSSLRPCTIKPSRVPFNIPFSSILVIFINSTFILNSVTPPDSYGDAEAISLVLNETFNDELKVKRDKFKAEITIAVTHIGSFKIFDSSRRLLQSMQASTPVELLTVSSFICNVGLNCTQQQIDYYGWFKEFFTKLVIDGSLNNLIKEKAIASGITPLYNASIDQSSVKIGELLVHNTPQLATPYQTSEPIGRPTTTSTNRHPSCIDSTEPIKWLNDLNVDCIWVANNADITCREVLARAKCPRSCGSCNESFKSYSPISNISRFANAKSVCSPIKLTRPGATVQI